MDLTEIFMKIFSLIESFIYSRNQQFKEMPFVFSHSIQTSYYVPACTYVYIVYYLKLSSLLYIYLQHVYIRYTCIISGGLLRK